jgi:hypothetical protein
VCELLAHEREILSTTGANAAVDELVLRTNAIEQALVEIASEVQRLAAAQEAMFD